MESESRNEFSINWKIENFSFWFLDPFQRTIASPRCTAENLKKSEFFLDLYREKKWPGDDEYLLCRLRLDLDDVDGENIPIEYTMGIIYAGGKALQSETFSKSEDKDINCLEWKYIMKMDELLNKMQNWTEDTLTVRCHILGEVKTRQPRIECEITTKFGVDRYFFLWKVNYYPTSYWSESENFCFHDQTFKITLSAPEDDVIINIQRGLNFHFFVSCRMSLIDNECCERYSQSANYLFSAGNDAVWKFPTFFTKTQLDDEENNILMGGRFGLTCNFSVLKETKIHAVKYRTLLLENASCIVDATTSLKDDLHGMLTSKKHADVKLRVDNEIFPVHKGLLSARSPVFSAMFDQDMLESRTGIVDIEDLDVKTMKSFLEFLYTGTVDDMDYDNASKLLLAAEKYQVLSLKEKCASFLMSILSEENVCDITSLSDKVGHELLKTSALDYIRSHRGNILRSPQWFEWIKNNVQLAAEIVCMLSTDIATGKQCRK